MHLAAPHHVPAPGAVDDTPTAARPTIVVPGGWVTTAQTVLDDLAEMTTFEQVAARYTHPREIAVAVLGHPVAGGTATRRVIRALGRLLQHRLGPALAVEALSWAASVAEAVDPATIEQFLETAATSDTTFASLRLDDRLGLVTDLDDLGTERARRDRLTTWWAQRRPANDENVWWSGWHLYWSDPIPCEWINDDFDIGDPRPGPRVGLIDRVVRETTGARQLAVYTQADSWHQQILATDPDLFDLKPALVQPCVLDHISVVLNCNPACPDGLADRVRHPYDPATLELAVRAGPRWYSHTRVRRMLGDRTSVTVTDLAARIPELLFAALADTGILCADDLIGGVLGHLDGAAVFRSGWCPSPVRSPDEFPVRRGPPAEWAVALLERHMNAAGWTWLLEAYDPPTDEMLDRLAHATDPAVRHTALRHRDPATLTPADAALAIETGGRPAAGCPGIPANQRPASIEVLRPADTDEIWLLPDPSEPRRTVRYGYPIEIEALTTARFDTAPGWRVGLPRTSTDLERNARRMGNCTAGYHDAIAAGQEVILIIHDLDGEPFNIALRRDARRGSDRPRWTIGEINSRDNTGQQPGWIRPALHTWFTHQLWADHHPDHPEPCPRTTRRRRHRPRWRVRRRM